MATLGTNYANLVDMAKAKDEATGEVVNILKQINPILDDAIAIECNNGTSHKHTIQVGLPSVSWGMLYKGTAPTKGTRAMVEDTTGFVEKRSSVDEREVKLYGAKAAQYRLSESMASIEALSQEVATGVFYHDTATTPEKFKGLSARFGVKATSGAGAQIIDAGGSGSDNTSIWMVTWGERFCSLLHPANIPAGLVREDLGRQRVLDADGNPYEALEEKYSWHVGMAVRDWRYVSRVANIDVSDMAAGSVDLYKWLRKAYYANYSSRNNLAAGNGASMAGKVAIYMNAGTMEALDGLATNSGGSDNFTRLQMGEKEGKVITSWRGIPIRLTDAILNTEARVV